MTTPNPTAVAREVERLAQPRPDMDAAAQLLDSNPPSWLPDVEADRQARRTDVRFAVGLIAGLAIAAVATRLLGAPELAQNATLILALSAPLTAGLSALAAPRRPRHEAIDAAARMLAAGHTPDDVTTAAHIVTSVERFAEVADRSTRP